MSFRRTAPQTDGTTRPVSERRDGRSPDLLINTVRCLPKTNRFSGVMAHNSQLTVAGTAPDLNRVPFSLAVKQEPSDVHLREMACKVKRFNGPRTIKKRCLRKAKNTTNGYCAVKQRLRKMLVVCEGPIVRKVRAPYRPQLTRCIAPITMKPPARNLLAS